MAHSWQVDLVCASTPTTTSALQDGDAALPLSPTVATLGFGWMGLIKCGPLSFSGPMYEIYKKAQSPSIFQTLVADPSSSLLNLRSVLFNVSSSLFLKLRSSIKDGRRLHSLLRTLSLVWTCLYKSRNKLRFEASWVSVTLEP